MATSLGHDLTRDDPGRGIYHPPTPQTRARAERLASMSDGAWAEVERNWKSGWACNKRKEEQK